MLWRQYWRASWHGYGDTFEAFKALPFTDRFLCLSELNELIVKTNEKGTGRPKDDR